MKLLFNMKGSLVSTRNVHVLKRTKFLNEMNVEKYFIIPNTGPNYIYLSVP